MTKFNIACCVTLLSLALSLTNANVLKGVERSGTEAAVMGEKLAGVKNQVANDKVVTGKDSIQLSSINDVLNQPIVKELMNNEGESKSLFIFVKKN
jgi:hypothetical protein